MHAKDLQRNLEVTPSPEHLHPGAKIDILRVLRGADSLSRRSMSRTEEDIASRVDIPIMRDTTLNTYPASYSELCDTFRPRLACARRTDSGRERFIHFIVPSPVRDRFVAEHVSEGRPASIQYRFRQAGLGESGGIHIADGDVVELSNDADRELMVKVPSRIADARVQIRGLTLLTRPLGGREFVSQLSQQPWVLDFLAIRQGSEVFEAQVDANAASHRPQRGLRDFHDDVQEPIPARITGEACAILDLAVRQRSRVEHPKGVSGKAKGLPLAFQIPAFQGYPAQRALPAPAQERAVLLTAGFGVLFAHSIDRARVQGKFLAAARGQAIEVKAARPTLIPFQRLELSVVAEIPDEVAGTRLAVEQSGQRLDAVSIDQQHRRKLYRLRDLGKTPKLTETSISKGSKTPPQERHFLPGASAGVSVPENR